MAINNKCKNCGSELVYDADSGELKCISCGSIEDIPEQLSLAPKKAFNNNSTIKLSKVENVQYHCSTCGRTHNVSVGQELLNCPSCGDVNLEKTTNVTYMPDGIIPFTLNKEKALNSFKDWLKHQKFVPNNLKRLAKTQKMTGVYIPIYCYDLDSFTKYSGVGVKVRRDGEKTYETRHPFSSTCSNSFTNQLESASSSFSKDYLEKIANFNFSNIYVYRPEFLYGWVSVDVNIDLQSSYNNMKTYLARQIKRRIQNRLNYDRIEQFFCETTFSNVKYNYIYVPMWINNYKYKNKIYNCYINGVTGKVTGKSPKSFWKILLLVLGIGAVIGGIAYTIVSSGLLN